MKIFEPHIHMTSRTTDDYEAMAMAGVKAVCEPSFWLGQPRTSVGSFKDYFDTLLGWERFRANQFGIKHYCTMALNPKEANDDRVNDGVIELLEEYVHKEGVIGIGEIGFDDITPKEEKYFRKQIELALRVDKPMLIHTPHRDKLKGVKRIIAILHEMGVPGNRALIDHNNELSAPLLRESEYYAAFSIYPGTKMTPERTIEVFRRFGTDRFMINSAGDWGISDPLLVPKTVQAMRKAGMDEDEIEKVVWTTPVSYFASSGQISFHDFEDGGGVDGKERHQGNTVLRG